MKQMLSDDGKSFSHRDPPPHSPDLILVGNCYDVLEKTLHSGPTIPLSTSEFGEKFRQS